MKDKVANPPGLNPQRGWTGVGIESTSRLSKIGGSRLQSDAKVNDVNELVEYEVSQRAGRSISIKGLRRM
jgi:hypothetical protein